MSFKSASRSWATACFPNGLLNAGKPKEFTNAALATRRRFSFIKSKKTKRRSSLTAFVKEPVARLRFEEREQFFVFAQFGDLSSFGY